MQTPVLGLGTNFAVFLLFFGLSLVEAFQTRDWLRVLFWVGIAAVFLYGDRRQARDVEGQDVAKRRGL